MDIFVFVFVVNISRLPFSHSSYIYFRIWAILRQNTEFSAISSPSKKSKGQDVLERIKFENGIKILMKLTLNGYQNWTYDVSFERSQLKDHF
jgi:hypothetical protein